jgi:hypothetical protein
MLRNVLADDDETADHMMLWIRVYDDAGNVIETHEHHGDFKEP